MLTPVNDTPTIITQAQHTILYDIARLVNAVYQQNIEPTKEGKVPKRISNKLSPQLAGKARGYEGDDDYLNLLMVDMLHLKLVDISPATMSIKQRLEAGEELAKWSTLSLQSQTRRFLDTWIRSPAWFDQTVTDETYNIYNIWGPDILKLRKVLMDHLFTLKPDHWYKMYDFLEEIRKKMPEVIFSRYEYDPFYYSKKETKVDPNAWHENNGKIFRNMLNTTLTELGMVSLGRTIDDPHHINALLFTQFGQEVCTPTADFYEEQATTQKKSLIVQPNFEIHMLEIDSPTLYKLLPFTEAKQIGHVSQLLLTQKAVQRGIHAGHTIEQIQEILEAHSNKKLPQNVQYSLQDWGKKYTVTKMSSAVVLEVANEEQADSLCQHPNLKKANVRKIAPRILLLDIDANLQQIRNTLEKEGIAVQLDATFPPRQVQSYTSYR